MFIHSNIRKLPVTTSEHPHICILPTATISVKHDGTDRTAYTDGTAM